MTLYAMRQSQASKSAKYTHTVHAIQYDGANLEDVQELFPLAHKVPLKESKRWRTAKALYIPWIGPGGGNHVAKVGSFIVKPENGEVYVVNPERFAANWKPVKTK